LDPEHESELEALKQSAVERFKHRKYLELSQEIKSQRDKRTLFLLKSELRALNYVPPETRSGGQETAEEETVAIQSRARALVTLFEEKESQLMLEDLEASMLCEVSRLNFLNFLKVFQAEVDLGDGDGVGEVSSALREEISNLNNQIVVLRSGLIVKVPPPPPLPPLHSSLTRDFLFSNKNFQRSNP
jgi:hypothetical protein